MDATARNDKVPFYLESLSKEGLLQSAAAEFNRLKVDNGNAPRGKEFSNPPELEIHVAEDRSDRLGRKSPGGRFTGESTSGVASLAGA